MHAEADEALTMEGASTAIAIDALLLSLVMATVDGCISAVLALSASLVEPQTLYTAAGGTLFTSFALSALFAPIVVVRLGLGRSIFVGIIFACIFIMSLTVPTAALLVPCAALSGIGFAIMWTAQGPYLFESAARFALLNSELARAQREGVQNMLLADADPYPPPPAKRGLCRCADGARFIPRPRDAASAVSLFSGTFAAITLITLVLFKLLASIVIGDFRGLSDSESGAQETPSPVRLPGQTGSTTQQAAVLYACFAVASFLAALLSLQLRGVRLQSSSAPDAWATLHATLRVLISERALSMALTNVTFGLMDAFFPTIVTSAVADAHGSAAAALLYLLSNVTAALAAVPLASASGPRGRAAVVCLGGAAFLAPSLAVLLLEESRYTQWDVLAVLFVLYGVGVSVWQGAVMALWAELFAGELEVAFAPLKVQSGGASAVAFFTFRYLTDGQIAALCAASAVLGISSFLVLCAKRRGRA